MTIQKPIGGKQMGVYLLFPEAKWKEYKTIAKKAGYDTVDEYFMQVIDRYHQCEEWRGT
jgi:hypothetical protein